MILKWKKKEKKYEAPEMAPKEAWNLSHIEQKKSSLSLTTMPLSPEECQSQQLTNILPLPFHTVLPSVGGPQAGLLHHRAPPLSDRDRP